GCRGRGRSTHGPVEDPVPGRCPGEDRQDHLERCRRSGGAAAVPPHQRNKPLSPVLGAYRRPQPMRYSLRLACVLAAALAVAALLPLSPAQAGPPASGGGDVAERLAEMTRSIEIDGETLDFTTRAGTLVVRNDEGEQVAELFYVAHELDGTDRDRRPLTFIWDGGPGGSTMLMDVLGYGPLRHAPATNPKARAPFRADPNPRTLLRQSDLVFIDLIGTGYSRAVGRARNSDFWGVGPDADVTAKAIERYLKLTRRWQSPKFLLGN